MATKINIYKDTKKEYRVKIIAGNGQNIGTAGESYKTHEGAKKAAERFKTVVPGAKIIDKT